MISNYYNYIQSGMDRFIPNIKNSFNNLNCSDFFVELDTLCDYIPGVSIISNLIDLFQKYVIHPFFPGEVKDRYWSHIEQKDLSRELFLLIPYPILPQFIIFHYDSNKAYERSINRSLESQLHKTEDFSILLDTTFSLSLPLQKKTCDNLAHIAAKIETEFNLILFSLIPTQDNTESASSILDTDSSSSLRETFENRAKPFELTEFLPTDRDLLFNRLVSFRTSNSSDKSRSPEMNKWLSTDKKALFKESTKSKTSETEKYISPDKVTLFGNSIRKPKTYTPEDLIVSFKEALFIKMTSLSRLKNTINLAETKLTSLKTSLNKKKLCIEEVIKLNPKVALMSENFTRLLSSYEDLHKALLSELDALSDLSNDLDELLSQQTDTLKRLYEIFLQIKEFNKKD